MSATRRALRKLAPCSVLWRRGLPSEVAFWEDFLRGRGADWPDDFRQRFTPGAMVNEPLIIERLGDVSSDPVSILDVGAGPASSLGSALPDRRLELVAVDPLADEYDRLLEQFAIQPPVRVMSCRGERIGAHFDSRRFDFVYARNSLDHCVDPASVLRQMLLLTRPGGFVVLRHWRNEAENARYEELHQWNIDVQDGELVIWNLRHRHRLAEIGAGLEFEAEVAVDDRMVTAVLSRAGG